MTALATAFVDVRPNTDKFESDFKKKLGKVNTTASGDAAGKKFASGFQTGISGGLSKALGAAALGAGLFKFGKSSVAAYKEAQTSQKELADAFERFPKLAGTNQVALQKMNSELQKKTRFDDDSIASGQAVIAQFGLTGKQLEEVTPLLLDYASRTGKDIPAAAQDVGKALLGNAKALKNIGIKYTATGDTAKDFTNITALLRQQVGGFSEKEGTTAAGQAAILKNQFGELQEMVGSKLVPVLGKAAEFGTKVIIWLSENKPVATALAIVVGGVLVGAFVALAASVIAATWPFIAAGVAIAGIVAGIVYAYQHFETFRNIADAVLGFFRDHWKLILSLIVGPIGAAVITIVRHWDGIVEFFKSVPGKIGSALGAVGETLISPFRTAFNQIAHLWNTTVGKISFHVPDWVPEIGGNGFSVPKIPEFAGGTMYAPRGLAWVGENGPELVKFRGGEQVHTANESANLARASSGPDIIELHVDLGEGIKRVVQINLSEHDRGLRRRATAMA